ncbi:unnamed protein product [Rotaria magnacalcarata]|uniref:Uncharacterized protein n=1 Tax=Rotaria magnacalcarata TaxID=392030 RepID=A0A820H1Z9_9BILA|nr:unnamed protein product [Rotaria magnacalcarata]
MQRYQSKGSVTSVTSSSKRISPTHMIIQREDNNQMLLLPVTHLINASVTKIKVNNTATFKTDLKSRKQERGRVIQLAMKPITSFDIREDTNIVVSSHKKTTDILKQKGITNEKQLESDEERSGTRNESQQDPRQNSTRIINSKTQNSNKNVEKHSTMIECLDSQQGHAPDTSYLDVMPRLEFLSKRCNQLTKENADLQEDCDRLTTENQKLKRTMMPMPDASGRQWFINMGKYFSQKSSNCDVVKYATALKINDPNDLLACVQATTSNTARQVIRLLYSPEQLLSMTGPEVPDFQRKLIRQFAESQLGPILDHNFNEAINGVFRSEKSEFKKKLGEGQSTHALSTQKSKAKTQKVDNHQTNLKKILNKNQTLQPTTINSNKENLPELS